MPANGSARDMRAAEIYVSLEEAAAAVKDGDTLALGGVTLYRRPLSFVKALLRRRKRPRDLTLLSFTGGLESDLLVGAGCVKRVRSAYFGLEAFGLAPMFTQFAQSQRIEVIEETEASIVMGIRARIAGVGFLPSRAWLGTDLPTLRPDVKTVEDPYSGDELAAFPAIACEVAVIHGLAGDREGNVLINNNLGIDLELVYVAQTVIATVERVVERLERTTDGVIIPYPGCDMVVEAPQGAAPTSCYPLYPLNGGDILRYTEACNGGRFTEYLERLLHS
ncbi:MAG: CoA transferase subunit A [Chloroflexota bacterium]|nr:CoA transferase subunit A [Chloroflexota bacterium]